MTNPTDCVEIITSVQRRRRWTASEKVRMTVSLVARRHGVASNQLFTWRRLVAQGGLSAVGSGEEVVPASDYRALQNLFYRGRHSMPSIGKTRRNESLFFVAYVVITDITAIRHASIEIARWSCAVPFALPAAGLPITRGGNALAVSAEHFFATSAVTADALFVVEATAMQFNPANTATS